MRPFLKRLFGRSPDNNQSNDWSGWAAVLVHIGRFVYTIWRDVKKGDFSL